MKIAIVGAGVEGRALVHYFLKKGAEVHLRDKRTPEIDFPKVVHGQFGESYLQGLEAFDVVFRSPGVPFLTPELQALVKKKVKVSSLTRYFFEKCPCPIIGVTGTKGKGTVATLLYEILKAEGKRVFLGGNIGVPPLEFLDGLKKTDLVVLELSSFQLQDADKSPHIAVVLPISEDHLDHHQTMKEYVAAKKNIVKFQTAKDFAVANVDNQEARDFLKSAAGAKYEISLTKAVKNGGFLEGTELVLVGGKKMEVLCDASEIRMPGLHNVGNVLQAAVAAQACGVPIPVIRNAVKKFQGLPHRLEFVRDIDGVQFYNDSASTNPETCIAALRAFEKPIILIAGGSSKGLSFDRLGMEIVTNKRAKAIILLGQTTKQIEASLDRAIEKFGRTDRLDIITAENFAEALLVAKALAEASEIVLLSPACASYDMFGGYQERGDLFKRWVLSL